MFFISELSHTIHLSPNYFDTNLQYAVRSHLLEEVEGACSSDHGFILAVISIQNVGEAVLNHMGSVLFKVKYTAITLKPVRNEVIEAKVDEVNKMGLFAHIGPLSIFVSNYQIPNNLQESIKKDTLVRLKIIGTKIDKNEIYAVGTINEEFLGVIL
ncbi:hypothetical protein VCUG_02589 [Vavraia culicis subsp. floridensis]|uniref:S1 motif domain-containing protein n=1 Tax=Vavraia culicis (isolate floridensis) TaxID=948595 RepID=L2GS71_VAVCU|nr:uncharacterized protein VCUG_02589 [Vavraia culicis subsp. floridensis]ELA45920.1 hypothetical protein VCUG_02589 [Vavraia culicis subsp. floridensis]